MIEEELEKRAKEYARKDVYYGAYVDDEVGMEIAEEAYIEATKQETKLLQEQIAKLEAQIEKMKRHANCKYCDSEGYCEVRKTYLMDLSYDGCDKWEL